MDRIRTAVDKVRGSLGLFSTGASDRGQNLVKSLGEPDDQGGYTHTTTKVAKPRPTALEKNRIVSFDRVDENAIAFDILRTKVLQTMDANGWRTIAVTSPSPACGKTFVAINLSIAISRQIGRSVLLADFDLRRPQITNYLGIKPKQSLVDFLEERADLSEVLINPNLPRIVVLPNTTPISHSAEILATPKVAHLVDEIKTRYEDRVAVFDLPPMLSTDDPLTFIPYVDCVLLVTASGISTKKEIERSRQLLKGANVIGTLFNKSEESAKSYGYGYGYGY